MMDIGVLALFTLELVYYLSVDHMLCATLAGIRIVGLLVWILVTKRRAPEPSADTSYQSVGTSSQGATVIPLHKTRKKRF